jgi:hypothetical protein
MLGEKPWATGAESEVRTGAEISESVCLISAAAL